MVFWRILPHILRGNRVLFRAVHLLFRVAVCCPPVFLSLRRWYTFTTGSGAGYSAAPGGFGGGAALTAIFVVFCVWRSPWGSTSFPWMTPLRHRPGAQVRNGSEQNPGVPSGKSPGIRQVHASTIMVLSADWGVGEEMTEAEAMYEYLKAHGIPNPHAGGADAPAPTKMCNGKQKTPDHPGRDGSVGVSVPSRRGGIHPRGDHNQQLPTYSRAKAIARKTGNPASPASPIQPRAVFTLLQSGNAPRCLKKINLWETWIREGIRPESPAQACLARGSGLRDPPRT